MNYKILREVIWETFKPVVQFIGTILAFYGYISVLYYVFKDPMTTLLLTILTIVVGFVSMHIRDLYQIRVRRAEALNEWKENRPL